MPYCKICFKEFDENSFNQLLSDNPLICSSCYKSFQPYYESFIVDRIKVFSIFHYEEPIRTLIFKLKGVYDIELAPVFLEKIKTYLHLYYYNYVIVPAPSTFESDKIRGFNHVIEIGKSLNLKIVPLISKTTDVKQSSMNKLERQNIGASFKINENYLKDIKGKKVLILDDIYTTGSTFKAMIKLIKDGGAKKIRGLIIARNVEKVGKIGDT